VQGISDDLTIYRLAKWHSQPMSNIAEYFSLILVKTEFIFPTILLQLSLMKATIFFPLLRMWHLVGQIDKYELCCADIVNWHTQEPLIALSLTSSKYLTTIARVFRWLVSIESSHSNEKGPVLHCFTSSSFKAGAMAFLTIIVVLVRPQENCC